MEDIGLPGNRSILVNTSLCLLLLHAVVDVRDFKS